MPGKESIRFSNWSALGVCSIGGVDEYAGLSCELRRSCMSVFLRVLLVWWAERPAVWYGSGLLWHGHGSMRAKAV